MCKNGSHQVICIDNYIPCTSTGSPCFSQANGNELWVIILEKAWAKIHGSYERIIGGQAHHTFRDLTGAPGYEFESTSEGAFARVLEGEKLDYAMAAGINTASEAETRKIEDLGLVAGHSYGLIAAAIVTNKNGEKVQLVQLRNPWGKFEW